ncbi:hypothetical protein GSI_03709 [Ganoderma sinense ZZ0214-1]|uniref:GmrSD restriction endonucleases N-terminal domain-containing protein n=1 Tax=Ganoderma sinense ZZ0214-1 TaxID=1077348 RepID=A0A2G8SJQ5_9APHY|nr:hypothetical protein GSI_03709 [Ganoderma sinense ZZ0214-1]
MSDHDDEWDELEEENEPKDPNVFELDDCLAAPSARSYTTRELHALIHEGVIDLNPPYQREIVWPEAKQSKLLDSIWRNFYVPPVVFAVYTDDEGERVKCCVDGKQRLTSIQRFFDGQIPYVNPKTKKKWWYTISTARKQSKLEIPERYKEDFAEKIVTCVEYHGLPHVDERDIFQRVQMGVALTAAEKLQAIPSPWSEWIGELQSRYVYIDDSLTQKINVTIKRGQDFQLIAGIVYCCDKLSEQEQAMPSSNNLNVWLSREDPPPDTFKGAIRDLFNRFWNIANDDDLNMAFTEMKQRVAPAEFIFTGVLLYVLRDRSPQEQAQAIYDLRSGIRDKHHDIRTRGDIIRDLWMMIDELSEDVVEEVKPSKKSRKQRDDAMDLDDDYRPKKKGRRK